MYRHNVQLYSIVYLFGHFALYNKITKKKTDTAFFFGDFIIIISIKLVIKQTTKRYTFLDNKAVRPSRRDMYCGMSVGYIYLDKWLQVQHGYSMGAFGIICIALGKEVES